MSFLISIFSTRRYCRAINGKVRIALFPWCGDMTLWLDHRLVSLVPVIHYPGTHWLAFVPLAPSIPTRNLRIHSTSNHYLYQLVALCMSEFFRRKMEVFELRKISLIFAKFLVPAQLVPAFFKWRLCSFILSDHRVARASTKSRHLCDGENARHNLFETLT